MAAQRRRPSPRHTDAAPATTWDVPPGPEGGRPPGAHQVRWCLAVRAQELRLSPDAIAFDLVGLGLRPPRVRLRRVLVGVEPAEPALLDALIDVLRLRDRSLSHEQVVGATAGAWLAAGQRVPPGVLTVLADARGLTNQEVLNIAARSRARRQTT